MNLLRLLALLTAPACRAASPEPRPAEDDALAPTEPTPLPWTDDPCTALATDGSAWTGVVDRFRTQDDLHPPAAGGLAVVGSSSIRRWDTAGHQLAPWGPVQRGVGGARMSDIAALADPLVLRHRPAGVLVFAGTNDLALGASPDAVVDAWRCLVQRVFDAQGTTPVWFIGITPTPQRWANQAQVDTANAAIAALAAAHPSLSWIDVPTPFLATGRPPAADLFVADGLHLSDEGYALWADVIVPAVRASLPERPPGGGAGFEGYLRVDLGPSNPEDGWRAPAVDAFGNHWNTWHDARGGEQVLAGEALRGLVTTAGLPTAVELVIEGGFRANGLRNGGLISPPGDRLQTLAVPEATADFFYLEDPDDPGALGLLGLDPERSYTLRLFASRATDEERRVTRYLVRGGGPVAEATLVTSGPDIGRDGYDGNDGEVAVLTCLRPDAWGGLHIDVDQAEGRFAYLSLLELQAE